LNTKLYSASYLINIEIFSLTYIMKKKAVINPINHTVTTLTICMNFDSVLFLRQNTAIPLRLKATTSIGINMTNRFIDDIISYDFFYIISDNIQ